MWDSIKKCRLTCWLGIVWRDITDVTLTLSVIHGDHVIRSVQPRTLHYHHHATQHPRQLKLSFFLSRWRIFYFQLCLVTMSVVSETATQISFLDRSLQLLQLPPWNLLFPQRRTFVPQIAKSPRKISSHPKKHFNRQLAGYFYWRKDPHRRVFLPIFKSLKSA